MTTYGKPQFCKGCQYFLTVTDPEDKALYRCQKSGRAIHPYQIICDDEFDRRAAAKGIKKGTGREQ